MFSYVLANKTTATSLQLLKHDKNSFQCDCSSQSHRHVFYSVFIVWKFRLVSVTIYIFINLKNCLPSQAVSCHLPRTSLRVRRVCIQEPLLEQTLLSSFKVHILVVRHTNGLLGNPEALTSHRFALLKCYCAWAANCKPPSLFQSNQSWWPLSEEQKKQPPGWGCAMILLYDSSFLIATKKYNWSGSFPLSL